MSHAFETWMEATPLTVECDACERRWEVPLGGWDLAWLSNGYGHDVVEKRIERSATAPYVLRCPPCLLRFESTPAEDIR